MVNIGCIETNQLLNSVNAEEPGQDDVHHLQLRLQVHQGQGSGAVPVPGQRVPHSQLGLRVRLDQNQLLATPTTLRKVPPPGLQRPGLPLQPVRQAGAEEQRGNRAVCQGEVQHHLGPLCQD